MFRITLAAAAVAAMLAPAQVAQARIHPEPPGAGSYQVAPGDVVVHWVGIGGPTVRLNECSYLTGVSLCTSSLIPNAQTVERDGLEAAPYTWQVCTLPTALGITCTPYTPPLLVTD